MNRREAITKALSKAWNNIHTNEALGFQNMLAQHAINASDEVMFSDETVERIAESLTKQFVVEREMGEYDANAIYATPEEIVRTVIEELKKS